MSRLTILLVGLLFAIGLFAQGNFDEVKIKEHKLSERIYMLEGAGGNIGLYIGDKQAILVDDQYAPLSDRILAKVDELTDLPVRQVINTHWHGDHTGGNANMAHQGAMIIAHENVYKRMSVDQKRGDRVTPASPPEALPKVTYEDIMRLRMIPETVLLTHVHDAHTDGDTYVYFMESNVLHMGDCFFHKRFPFIDASSGGSLRGAIEAVEVALMMVDDKTQIIPGHGPMADKDDLRDYHFFLQEIEQRMQAALAAEKTLDEIDPKSIVKGYEAMTWSFINEETFVRLLYSMLKK